MREGRFLFDFSKRPEYVAPNPDATFDQMTTIAVRRAEFINSHVLCLHIALSREQRLALRKPVVSPVDFIGYDALAASANHGWIENRLTPFVTASSISSYNQLSPSVFDWRLANRTTVSEDTLVEASRLLQEVTDNSVLPLIAVADLYLRSTAHFESHDYNLALVGAWAIIETALQALWERFIDENRVRTVDGSEVPFINAERRGRLVSGRDYTASVVSETLSLLNALPHAIYVDLDKVRRDRNSFLHDLAPVSRAAADRALSVAERMLLQISAVDLAAPRLSVLGG